MDVAVPPIVRGEFLYRDALLVDVGGEGRRHPRASETELKNLLNGKAPKDQVAHWYEAQLIHYGLQRSKEKNTAKVRLQQAISQGKLKVPAHLSDMETQMKKDYASAVRKAKAQSKSGAEKSTPTAQKRKNDEETAESSKRTKISMNVGDISINIEQGSSESAKKKAATKESKPVSKPAPDATRKNGGKASKAKDTDQSSSKPKAKATKDNDKPAKHTAVSTASKSKASSTTANSTQSPAKAGMKAKKDAKFQLGSKVKPEPKVKAEPKAKPEPKVKTEPKGKTDSKVKTEAKVKAEPKVKTEPRVKAEPKVKKEPVLKPTLSIEREPKIEDEDDGPMWDSDDLVMDDAASPPPHEVSVTGVYDLSCPQLEEQEPACSGNLRLFLCVDNDHLWGSFELANKSGVLHSNDLIPATIDLSFGWRARDGYTGRLDFGRGCHGSIEFGGQNQVQGMFWNLFDEPLEFEGWRRPGPLWCGRSAYSFQREWDGFVGEAYGR